MRAIRKILAAVDTSQGAAGVLAMAEEMAKRFGASVHLFRVVDLPAAFPPAAAAGHDDLPEVLRAQATADLRKLADDLPDTVVEPPALSGREPWRVILEKARDLDADLIVIGTHAFGGWDRLMRTSAAHIAEQAGVHVMVVHA